MIIYSDKRKYLYVSVSDSLRNLFHKDVFKFDSGQTKTGSNGQTIIYAFLFVISHFAYFSDFPILQEILSNS